MNIFIAETCMQRLKESLLKIVLTLSGPIFTYGLYYFDIFSDFFFMITLFMNCHKYYGITSLTIICLSYATTAVFIKFRFNIEFKKSLCYPLNHGKNLLIQVKDSIMSIWNGKPFPDESEESKVFGHHIAFMEAMSESMPQLCLQLIVLREFGVSKEPFQSFTQSSCLISSLISICLLFSKVSYAYKLES